MSLNIKRLSHFEINSYSCNVITETDVCLVKSINPKLKYAQCIGNYNG